MCPHGRWLNIPFLAQKLVQTNNAVLVFFGGKGDKPATADLIAQLPPGAVLDLTAALPLAQLPAAMNLLDAYIGCDTGLTHLAAALGKEVASRILEVEIRSVYGNQMIYPANKVAQDFADLLNVKTFNKYQIEGIKKLGYEIVRVAQQVRL